MDTSAYSEEVDDAVNLIYRHISENDLQSLEKVLLQMTPTDRMYVLSSIKYGNQLVFCTNVVGNIAMINFLVEHCGIDVFNIKDELGLSLFSYAVQIYDYKTEKEVNVIQYLLDNGADVHSCDSQGRTPLMMANRSEHLCGILIKNGAVVNARDKHLNTPLHKSVTKAITSLLIKHGAEVTAKNSEGFEPVISIARETSNPTALDPLLLNESVSPQSKASACELVLANIIITSARHSTYGLKFWNAAEDDKLVEKYMSKACSFYPILERKDPVKQPREEDGIFEFQTEAVLYSRYNSSDLSQGLSLVEKVILAILMKSRILGEATPEVLYGIFVLGYVRRQFDSKAAFLTFKYAYIKYLTMLSNELANSVLLDIVKILATVMRRKRDTEASLEMFRYSVLHVRHCLNVAIESKTTFNNDLLTYAVLWLYQLCHKDLTDSQKSEVMVLTEEFCSLYNTHSSMMSKSIIGYALDICEWYKDDDFEIAGLLLFRYLFRSGFSPTDPFIKSTFVHRISTFRNFKIIRNNNESLLPFKMKLLTLALENGAHLDFLDCNGVKASEVLKENNFKVDEFSYTTLKCLATAVILKSKLNYKAHLPILLTQFVEMHDIPKF